jgi:hypothetical protein
VEDSSASGNHALVTRRILMVNIGAERGCGTRVQGGVYAECRLGADGDPIESFLIDPPVKVPMEALGLSAVGIRLTQHKDGFPTHILDVVGASYYPNVADFVEEVKVLGLSRRLPTSLDFSELSPGSRIILAHSKAVIENPDSFYEEWEKGTRLEHVPCPKEIVGHIGTASPHCAHLWWHDIQLDDRCAVLESGQVRVGLPSLAYQAYLRPEGWTPKHEHGFFLSLPLTNVTVIKADDDSHEETYESVQNNCGLPVWLENS